MKMRRVCYFETVSHIDGERIVRFGTCRRPEAQISTRIELWSKIVDRFMKDGYQIVEINKNSMAHAE